MSLILSQQQHQGQVQRQELVPAQIQSLEILQTAMPELEQKLAEILASNPTLELVRGGNEQLAGNPTEGDTVREDAVAVPGAAALPPDDGLPKPGAAATFPESGAAAGMSGFAEDFEPEEYADATMVAQLAKIAESWREYLPGESTGHAAPTEDDEERRQHRFDSITMPVGLQDLLMGQLRQQVPASATERLRIGEEIIGSIDESGYLRTHVADIAMACAADTVDVKKVLEMVQQFDPPGVGARDLRECLMLQLDREGQKNSLEYQAVSKCLEDLGRNQIPRVARILRVSPGKVYEILQNIRQLRPHPGRRPEESGTPTVYVVPEVTVFKDAKGNWQVEPNHEHRPQLRISPYYLRLLRAAETTAEVRQYIRQKLAESKQLLRALDQRQSTIERITWALIKHQPDFFEYGAEHLHPLTISLVAQELGLHETTIGRAVAEKFMQTPHGLFAYRRFFTTGGVAAGDGQLVSNQSVKQRIQILLRGEDSSKPLTDDQLVQLLAAEGLKLARRTVAKYREEIGIPPTHRRRSHHLSGTPQPELTESADAVVPEACPDVVPGELPPDMDDDDIIIR